MSSQNPTNINSLGVSLGNLLQIGAFIVTISYFIADGDKKNAIADQRIYTIENQFADFRRERNEDQAKWEKQFEKLDQKLDNISRLLMSGAKK